MRYVHIAAALALFAGSQARAFTIVAKPNPFQEVRYDRGTPMIVSTFGDTSVRIMPLTQATPHGRLLLDISVLNIGKTPVNFGYENVSVRIDGAAARLWTYDELINAAKRKARWQMVAVALAAGGQSFAAAQPTTYSSYGSVYGTGGYANYSSYGTAYNPALTSIAESQIQANTNANAMAISANLDAQMHTLDNRILRTTTVDPGTANGGAVLVDKPKIEKTGDVMDVTVTIGRDQHVFEFTIGK